MVSSLGFQSPHKRGNAIDKYKAWKYFILTIESCGLPLRIAKIAGLAGVALCWWLVRHAGWTDTWAAIVVWCAPPLTFPIAILGRRALEAKPDARRVERVTILVHYSAMCALWAPASLGRLNWLRNLPGC
jgi:hypothetical protein